MQHQASVQWAVKIKVQFSCLKCYMVNVSFLLAHVCGLYWQLCYIFFCYFSAKDKLYNDLVNQMVTEKAFFPNSMFNSTIEKHVGVIVNALWYIDGSKDKFETRCQKDPSYSIPTRCVFTSADLIIKCILIKI